MSLVDELRHIVFEAMRAHHAAPALLRRDMMDDTLKAAVSAILAALRTQRKDPHPFDLYGHDWDGENPPPPYSERKDPTEKPEGIFIPEAKGSCGWPPSHDWQSISAGISLSGWAKGERMHINRCRQCGEVRGPFINNSSDAGF